MKKQRTERVSLRFKALRLLADDMRSFLKGYRFAANHRKFFAIQTEAAAREDHMDSRNWHLLAEFSTVIRNREELGAMNQNRVSNMDLCCELIDGIGIEPGQVFSFRKLIGDPTPERGFLAGPMIVGGSLGSTTGGGLCQITTTLFNTALLAGLKILEKHNHSTDIWGDGRFIGLGQDAICVYGRKDLKFRNTLPGNILIRIHVNHSNPMVTCRIYSAILQNFTVEVTSRILKELKPKANPHKLPADGWQPVAGWIVETIRWVRNGPTGDRLTYRKREVYHPGWKKSRM